MDFLRAAVKCACLYAVIGHVLVLLGMFSIGNMTLYRRQVFFSFDGAMGVIGWAFCKNTSTKHKIMVLVHSLIHIGAAFHLFSVQRTNLYSDIFAMGELDFNDKKTAVIVFYIYGTTQDICTHGLNLYHLILDQPTPKIHAA
eukprot:108801_1